MNRMDIKDFLLAAVLDAYLVAASFFSQNFSRLAMEAAEISPFCYCPVGYQSHPLPWVKLLEVSA